jgi:LysW-gamma-L-lysine carboxypeptidase
MSLDPIALLRRMIEIESPSGGEGALADFLVARMAELNFAARTDRAGNAIGVREGSPPQDDDWRAIVLLGHMDTVPGRVPVRLEGERLYGRGAVDAKGPLAAFIAAAAAVDPPPGTRLVVVGAVEEESATSRGARHVATRYNPAACVIGEPSGWNRITLGYKGRLLVDYTLEQPAGHSAGPTRPVAEVAVAWWGALEAHARETNVGRDRLFDQLLPSLRCVQTSTDGLVDTVDVRVGYRLPPDVDVEALEETVRRLAGPAAVSFSGREAAFASGKNTPLVRALLAAIRRTGGSPRFCLKTGTSDMNVVGPAWGCPIVAYGPGDSRLDHTPNEHISIAEYLRAIDVLRTVFAESGLLHPGWAPDRPSERRAP